MAFLEDAKRQGRRWGPLVAAGALAGLVSAVPMGLAMIGLDRALPGKTRDRLRAGRSLPPRQITRRVLRWSGLRRPRRGPRWDAATWLGHVGYGAAAASAYPLVTRPLPWPGVLRGILFALGVWAGSYLGWLPALGVMPPATRQPARRNAIMVSAHVLWGALTALLTTALLRFAEKRGITNLRGSLAADDSGQSISP